MEFALLAKIALVIKGIVWSGYGLTGTYFVKTGYRYVQDYKDSISKEGV